MVTPEHEALHRIFQQDSTLFAQTMRRIFGVKVPVPRQVSALNVDLTETRPLERRVDSVLLAELLVEGVEGRYIVIVESQTDPEETRRSRWPYAVAYLHDKYGCDVVLLVVCSKRNTAAWARDPISIGLPGLTCMMVTPVVLGPDVVPAITDPADAVEDVGFTVFSALTHSRSEQVGDILEVLADALNTIEAESAGLLAEFAEAGLGYSVGRKIWRRLMTTHTYPYVSQLRSKGQEEGRAWGREEGRAEGHAEDILRILDRRCTVLTAEARARIQSCKDMETLDRWFDRALVITTVDELFASD